MEKYAIKLEAGHFGLDYAYAVITYSDNTVKEYTVPIEIAKAITQMNFVASE